MLGLILGALGVGASYLAQNKADKKAKAEAERNRQFQERMSSTAAQRSVADFTAAGLNPALAYGNTASTPGGATAAYDNSLINNGISNAQRAYQFEKDKKLQEQMNDAQYMMMREQAGAAKAANEKGVADAQLAREQTAGIRQSNLFNLATQPALLRQANADATLRELGIPAARNAASLEEFLGGSVAAQALRNRGNVLPAILRGMQGLGPAANKKVNELKYKLGYEQ